MGDPIAPAGLSAAAAIAAGDAFARYFAELEAAGGPPARATMVGIAVEAAEALAEALADRLPLDRAGLGVVVATALAVALTRVEEAVLGLQPGPEAA